VPGKYKRDWSSMQRYEQHNLLSEYTLEANQNRKVIQHLQRNMPGDYYRGA
jgi:hypothetical protein